MTSPTAKRIAAALGFLAVLLGAFGAHGLKDLLGRNGTAGVWETAVFYQFIHTVMLFVLAQKQPVPKWPFQLFLAGIVIFSGSLYLLAVTDIRWLGAITPFGGLSLLAGWVALFLAAKHE